MVRHPRIPARAPDARVGPIRWLAIGVTVSAFLSLPAFGELTPSNNQTDDRRNKNEEARDRARETNDSKITPNIAKHIGKAAEHMKRAEEARQQQDEGKAKQEEQMAMMEQMKAQQLDQQRKANEKSAQENNANAKKLQDPNEFVVPLPSKNNVVSLRDPDYSRTAKAEPSPSPSPSSPIPKEELANLSSNYVPAILTKPGTDKAPASPEPGDDTRGKFGYDERLPTNSKLGTTEGSVTAASTSSSSTSGPAPSSSMGTGTPSSASGIATTASLPPPAGGAAAGAGGGDFFSGIGGMVDEENQAFEAKEKGLSLKNLRGPKAKSDKKLAKGENGSTKELTDAEFWERVGKEPAKCGASSLGSGERRSCLRSARKAYEKKWRDSQRPTAPEKVQRSASR